MLTMLLLLLGAACGKSTTNDNAAADDLNAVIEDTGGDADVSPDTNEDAATNAGTTNTAITTNENDNVNARPTVNENANVTVNDGSITVSEPRQAAELTSPFAVKGAAEGTVVYVKVKNAVGDTMFTEPVSVKNGAFSINLSFEVSRTTTGTIVVFDKDASGNAQNAVSIPVKFVVPSGLPDTNGNANVNDNTNSNINDNENTNAAY